MWFFLLWFGFAIWVFFDSKNRRTNKGALWAVGTFFAGVIVLPIYFAKRNLYAGEVREGGTGWNAIKVFALYWTMTMLVAGIAGLGSASRAVSDASSSAEQAGTAIGSMLGLGLLIGLWFVVLAGALVIGLFLKKSRETLNKSVRGEYSPFAPFDTPCYARHSGRTGNVSNHSLGLIQRFPSIIENGPTGELAGQETSAKKLGGWILAVWVVIACMGVLVTSGKKNANGSSKEVSINSDKFAEELNAGDNAVECSNLEFQIADKELNVIYKSIMGTLSPDRKPALKSGQIEWIKTKEVECEAAAQGLMNPRHMDIATNNCLVEKTKQRIAYLKSFQ